MTARMTIAPPMIVRGCGIWARTSQTQNGAKGPSSVPMSAELLAGMWRAPMENNAMPMAPWVVPKTASHMRSADETAAGLAIGRLMAALIRAATSEALRMGMAG